MRPSGSASNERLKLLAPLPFFVLFRVWVW